jgi:hypothetical protein
MSLNDEIAEYFDARYAAKQALRDAHRAELAALFLKRESDCRLTYQMELAKRRKIPDRP